MKLTTKISCALAVTSLALAAALWFALQSSVAPQFTRLENQAAEENLRHAENGLAREIDHVNSFRADYGNWTTSYEYMLGRSPDFLDAEINPIFLYEAEVSIFLFFRPGGDIAGGRAVDLDTGAELPIGLFGLNDAGMWREWLGKPGEGGVAAGLVETPSGLMLISLAPITPTSGGKADYVGHLVAGRRVDARFVEAMIEQTQVDIKLLPIPESDRDGYAGGNAAIMEKGPATLTCSKVLTDLYGRPVAVLTATTQREISTIGESSLRSAFVLMMGGIAFGVGFVHVAFRILATKPIEDLTAHISCADQHPERADPALNGRSDEIGTLYKAFSQLLCRIGERTEELKGAVVAATAAEMAKSRFLANMSHEIRTPMNGVLGMAELLRLTGLDTKQRLFVDTIYTSGSALLTIVNDILDYSKIEAGKLELEAVAFDIESVVEDVVMLLSTAARKKGVELIVRVQPETPVNVVGDAGRLRQVMTNLVSNAVKFTREGHVFVNIAGESDGADANLHIDVEDTGIGIPAGKLESIFDQFIQGQNSTTREYGGTGLGLSIARSLVEAMSGSLSVTSKPGEGSTFTIRLRLPIAENAIPAPARAPMLDGMPVLILDDSLLTRRALEERLSLWGAIPVVAESAAAALQAMRVAAASGNPIPLALLGYRTQYRDGLALAKEIRADSATAQAGIIILSSVDSGEGGEALQAIGGVHLLARPAKTQLLRDAIVDAIGLRAAVPPRTVATQAASDVTADARPRREGRKPRLLIAEDNEVNRLVIGHMLDRNMYDVSFAENGRTAYENAFAYPPFDVIVMDVAMPEMDGLEATIAIRARERSLGRAPVPIIALTAHAMAGDRERFIEAGMDDYLPKPVQKKNLEKIIEKWLDGGSLRLRAAG